MSALLIFEVKGTKKDKTFNFLKSRFSVMGDSTDKIFSVFSEAFVRLLKIKKLRKFFQDIAKVITI